jgi:hypothetical protein
MVKCSVLFEVRTEFLNISQTSFVIQIATNLPWYVSNSLHKDLGILFFVDHIRALTQSQLMQGALT